MTWHTCWFIWALLTIMMWYPVQHANWWTLFNNNRYWINGKLKKTYSRYLTTRATARRTRRFNLHRYLHILSFQIENISAVQSLHIMGGSHVIKQLTLGLPQLSQKLTSTDGARRLVWFIKSYAHNHLSVLPAQQQPTLQSYYEKLCTKTFPPLSSLIKAVGYRNLLGNATTQLKVE